MIPLIINNQFPVQFKIDTGAQVNIIPKKYFDLITPKPTMKPTSQRLTSYCGARIPVTRVCELSCSYKDNLSSRQQFFVVETSAAPIIGYRSSLDLDLIKLVLNINSTSSRVPFLKEKHKEVFKGIGKLEGECNIYLKDNITPTVYPARRVPAAMQDKLKQELSHLEDLRIIEKVITPTEWVNSMVMVEKKGRVHKTVHRPRGPKKVHQTAPLSHSHSRRRHLQAIWSENIHKT